MTITLSDKAAAILARIADTKTPETIGRGLSHLIEQIEEVEDREPGMRYCIAGLNLQLTGTLVKDGEPKAACTQTAIAVADCGHAANDKAHLLGHRMAVISDCARALSEQLKTCAADLALAEATPAGDPKGH